ncbi:hypothetical protein SNE40_008355 [Patella caerulea]|uniref:Uncharacterized protein n=1 Tax=Patella caerulea TaxID=87958 RepID=A0AAN8K7Z8_PATCE
MLASAWRKLTGTKKLLGSKVLSYHNRCQIECTLECVTPTEDLPCGCVEYSYNMVTKQCLVVDESDDVTMADEVDWKTWNLV